MLSSTGTLNRSGRENPKAVVITSPARQVAHQLARNHPFAPVFLSVFF
jgi:hypothetical protein